MAKTRPGAEPPSAEPTRATARQRRIEAQRAKIDTVRREQRRRRAIWGTAILVGLAIVAAITLLLVKPPAAALGRQTPSEGRDHVPPGTPLTYRARPPSSGTHYDQTSGYGVFEKEIEPGYWVHTLEHGGVVVLYQPDLCDQSCVAELRSVYNAAPKSGRYGAVKMAVIPYRDMDHKIAAVAWTWVDEVDAVDRDRILAFYREHLDRGPEDAP